MGFVKLKELEKLYLEAVGCRCNNSDESYCESCKAVMASCKYIDALQAKVKEQAKRAQRYRTALLNISEGSITANTITLVKSTAQQALKGEE